MDYSLFLIVLEVPGNVEPIATESIEINFKESFNFKQNA